ncbi:MAG TPA: amidohydrolase family protein [Noviherbaspirillum sp.]|nr:amidohydrolase family protein [Noviherbaspirillum sp.]
MIIDSHAHVATEQVLPVRFFDGWVDNLERLLPPDAPPAQRASLTALFRRLNQDEGCHKLVAEMDRAGIAKTVLLIVDFGFAYPEERDRIEELYSLHRAIMASHPERFIVFAGIDPRRGRAGLDLVEKALRDWGFRGLKIYPPCGYSPSAKELYPFYEICQQYRVPVLSHIGPTSPTLSFKHTRPDDIEDAAFHFPGVNFILGHAGVVWRHEAKMLAAYRPNVYLDLSGFQPEWRRGELDRIIIEHKEAGLLRKLLFGTDWPIHRIHGGQPQWVEAFRDCASRGILSEEELGWIFYRNAAEILREPVMTKNREQTP